MRLYLILVPLFFPFPGSFAEDFSYLKGEQRSENKNKYQPEPIQFQIMKNAGTEKASGQTNGNHDREKHFHEEKKKHEYEKDQGDIHNEPK